MNTHLALHFIKQGKNDLAEEVMRNLTPKAKKTIIENALARDKLLGRCK